MPITFLPLASTDDYADGVHRRRFSSFGLDVSGTGAFGSHRRRLRTGGVSYDGALDSDPEIPALGTHTMYRRGEGAAASFVYASAGTHQRALRSYGFSAPAGYASGEHHRRITTWGRYEDAASGYALLMARPFQIISYANTYFELFHSTVDASAEFTPEVALLFNSVASLTDNSAVLAALQMTLSSSATVRAVFAVLFEAEFTETVLATDQLDALPRVLLALSDQLVVMGEVANQLDALVTLVSALAANDAVTYGTDLSVASEASAAAVFEEVFNALMTLVSEVDATDEATIGAGFSFLLSDVVGVEAGLENTVAALVELFDTVNVGARFNLPGQDGGLYVGYSMNVRTGGMGRYDNYPFVGFGTVGGLPLAIGEEGLYRLGGNDDAGEPIHAMIRTGLTNFGTEILKHNPNAYVGYTAEGALLLKVITTDKGRKKANYYQLRPRSSPAPTTDRFTIAKGLTGVYWGYQIENIDGAAFELDTIKVWPFPIQRRKSGR